ncbi:GCN5 family N-acetyltransferase [Actinorhabdospora filicis]|uniref:GCN5 family N-acetyltransferase n=1 Tax=Actinorhabdospora filicis TaxID=1785913 RepID=A0A9W6SM92_9ACTN|nr:GNAT family N-acetyltransferase [Actinorhabdospora filicis]GLZ78384.1 GCN5 family N-acetyltransferase [Actinorhabdospora filicis]
MTIRPAETRHFPALHDIEHAAAELYRSVGIPAIAELGPYGDDDLAGFVGEDLAWVFTDDADRPVAFLLAEIVDDCLYIAEVNVHPGSARQGLGRRLIDHAAAAGEYPALILTTFRDVPWNAPYYRRLGFVALADDEATPGLRAIREHQARIGLDRWPRVSMRRDSTTA